VSVKRAMFYKHQKMRHSTDDGRSDEKEVEYADRVMAS